MPYREPQIRAPLRALIQDFAPIWFTWCMNAGIISILLHQLPYQFRGLHVLSTIAFIIDLAYYEVIGDINDLALGACWNIAWVTLASLVCLIVSNASWGGHSWAIVGYVMWWIGVAWTLAYLLFVFTTLTRHHQALDRKLPSAIVIPAVAVATAATTGGLIVSFSSGISDRLAVPIIIVSFMMVGIGMLLSIPLYTFLLHGLLMEGWPAPPQVMSMWIWVGPMGQSSAALQILGLAASKYGRFGGYNKGTFLTAQAATTLEVICVLLGLLLAGMGTIWALMAFVASVEVAYKRQLTWNLSWNGIIFPMGTLTTAFLQFSIAMDSPAFRVVTTALVIFLVVVFLVNVGFAGWQMLKGQILVVRKNPRAVRENGNHEA